MEDTEVEAMDLNKLVSEYVSVQAGLVAQLIAEHPEITSAKNLLTAPASGRLDYLGSQWDFKKHGDGYRFSRAESEIVVDVHRLFREFPYGIDAWRLGTYLESLGYSDLNERHLSEKLFEMSKCGLIKAVSGEKDLYTSIVA